MKIHPIVLRQQQLNNIINSYNAQHNPLFINDRRLQNALLLLTSDDEPPLSEIAARCGYGGRTRLFQAFSERFAIPPEAVLSASEDDRAMLREHAARAMMDVWDRSTGRSLAS